MSKQTGRYPRWWDSALGRETLESRLRSVEDCLAILCRKQDEFRNELKEIEKTLDELKQEKPLVTNASFSQAAEWRAFVLTWWDRHEHYPVSARDLLPIAIEAGINMSKNNERLPHGQARSLGAQLTKHRNIVFDGLRINHYGSYNNRNLWSLVRVKTKNN